MIRIAIICLFLTGCATVGDLREVTWLKVDYPVLKEVCGGKPLQRLWGCAKVIGNQCRIYTLAVDKDPRILDTLGHELRHCFDGDWH